MKLLLQMTALVALGSVLYGKNGSSYDTSGNSLLQGAFNFRHLVATSLDTNGNPTEVTAAYGVITFDGGGNYSITGNYVDNTISGGAPQPLNVPSCASSQAPCGKYAIGASGGGYLNNPLSPGDASNVIRGAVAQGVFAGSDTESTRIGCPGNATKNCSAFDLFVAIPVGALSGNAGFATSYQVALRDFAGANSSAIKNAQANLLPDGNGGIATLLVNGQASNQPGSTLSQFVNSATYTVNQDSSITLTVPVPVGVDSASALFTGTRTLYVSGDGNFVLGWTPQGFDIIVGVKDPSAAGAWDYVAPAAPNGPQGFHANPKAVAPPSGQSSPSGLFFTSGIEDSPTGAGVDSFYGSISASGDSAGDAIAHQRVKSPSLSPYDYVSDDVLLLTSGGSAGDYNGYQYSFSANGQAFVGTGSSGNYSVIVGAQAPKFTGPGVFLNPVTGA